MTLSEEERLNGEEAVKELHRKFDEIDHQIRMKAIGEAASFSIVVAIGLGLFFGLVRFVKWAWNSLGPT